MAPSPLLPALALERPALQPLATLSILHTLRSVVQPLQAVLPELSHGEAVWLDSLLERTGSGIVFQGHPTAARHLDGLLRKAGFTTSINLLAHQGASTARG